MHIYTYAYMIFSDFKKSEMICETQWISCSFHNYQESRESFLCEDELYAGQGN